MAIVQNMSRYYACVAFPECAVLAMQPRRVVLWYGLRLMARSDRRTMAWEEVHIAGATTSADATTSVRMYDRCIVQDERVADEVKCIDHRHQSTRLQRVCPARRSVLDRFRCSSDQGTSLA